MGTDFEHSPYAFDQSEKEIVGSIYNDSNYLKLSYKLSVLNFRCFGETYSTLNFAKSVRKIKNKVCVSVFLRVCTHKFSMKDTVMFNPL